MSDERRTAAPRLPDDERAMQYALRVLGYCPRSISELRQRLEKKGCTPAITDRTLAELARLGLLDDREFAQSWVSHRQKQRGPALLRQELRRKGIDRDLAEEVITAEISADSECTAAWQVATRALRNDTFPPDRNALLRVRRLLQRRGFSFDVIGRVCARFSTQLTADGEWLE